MSLDFHFVRMKLGKPKVFSKPLSHDGTQPPNSFFPVALVQAGFRFGQRRCGAASLKDRVSELGSIDLMGWRFSTMGTILCIVGSLAAFLASTH